MKLRQKDQKIQVKVEDLFLHRCLFQEIKSLECDWGQMHHLVAQSGNDIFNRTSDNLGLIFFNSFLLEGYSFILLGKNRVKTDIQLHTLL